MLLKGCGMRSAPPRLVRTMPVKKPSSSRSKFPPRNPPAARSGWKRKPTAEAPLPGAPPTSAVSSTSAGRSIRAVPTALVKAGSSKCSRASCSRTESTPVLCRIHSAWNAASRAATIPRRWTSWMPTTEILPSVSIASTATPAANSAMLWPRGMFKGSPRRDLQSGRALALSVRALARTHPPGAHASKD